MSHDIQLNNNTKIPAIGFGTWQLTGDNCLNAIKMALEAGYRHIDTAEVYQNEEEVGQAIKQSNIPRSEIFLTSKAWQNELTYKMVLKACEISLRKLQTDYLDLYLLHWPDKYLNMEDILKAFKELYVQGKIKAFGISNCTINHIKDFLEITNKLDLPLTINQVEFHPLFYQKELLEFCNQNNIKITAYSPLAQGDVFKNPTLIEIANKHNKNAGQVALKWIIQKGMIAIPRSSKEDHIKNNFELDFQLSEEDIKSIDDIKIHERIVDPGFAEFDY
jgi:diketogulonate reductase-like aldo/keto reductase